MINLTLLEELEACYQQMKLFQRLFGKSVEITQDNFDLAVNKGLDIDWFIDHYQYFDEQHYKEYCDIFLAARNIYEDYIIKIWKEYLAKTSVKYDERYNYDRNSTEYLECTEFISKEEHKYCELRGIASNEFDKVKHVAQFKLLQQTFVSL